jgi:hypothetical protein
LGDTDHDCRLQLTDITSAVSYRIIRQRPDGSVTHGTTPVKYSVLEYEFKDMRGGEICDEDIARAKVFSYDSIDTSDWT